MQNRASDVFVLTVLEVTMEKLSSNFTIFLLFFGVSALEAFQTRNWPKAGFWLAIGIVFLTGDTLRKRV